MRNGIQQWLIVVPLLLCGSVAIAQNRVITGVISDATTKSSIPGVYIVLSPVYDTSKMIGTASDSLGHFQLIVNRPGEYRLKGTYIGYTDYVREIEVSETNLNTKLDTIKMLLSSTRLKGVVVNAEKPPVEQKGDTLQFNAEAYKTNPDATAEDLLEKMPGLTSNNGTVTSNGEQVVQVLVDGKPFFGDDPTLALKNLPAEVIDNIQVYDKLSDQAEFTGFDDGNQQKTINIITKRGKSNGEFGKFYAGYGTDERYIAGGNLNVFDGDRRFSVLELSNNINQQNFASQDLLGLSGGGGGRGGLGGGGITMGAGAGGQGGGGQAATNFLVGQQSGVATTNAAGLNYSDVWGKKKKLKITGSYFFNNSNTTNYTTENRNYELPSQKGQDYTESDSSVTKNFNHRVNFRLEYTIDTNNSIIWVPKFNFQRNNAASTTLGTTFQPNDTTGKIDTLNSTNVNNPSYNHGYDFSNSLTIRHKLHKKGRTISLNVSTDLNDKSGTSSMNSTTFNGENGMNSILNQHSTSLTNGYTVSGNLVYTEPAGKYGQVMLNYGPSYTRNNTDKETNNFDSTVQEYSLLDSALSNKFNSNYLANKGGAGYRLAYQKLNFMVSANYQYATLTGEEIYPTAFQAYRSFSNVLPLATMNYKFSKTKNIRIMYRTTTDVPSITQLQNVVNNSNPLLLSTGNVNLKQDYEQTLTMRYSQTNTDKGTSLFIYAYANNDMNYVSNETLIFPNGSTYDGIRIPNGGQITYPVNLNGYWNAKTSITFGKLIKKIKCNLNSTTGYSYTLNPGLIDSVINRATTHNVSEALVLSSNISENIDFTISTTPSYSFVHNSLQTEAPSNFNYLYLSSGIKFNWLFWKGFVFNTTLSQNYYHGLSADYNLSYFVWNLALGYKFLKDRSLEVKVTVFDVLNQNTSISRTVTEAYVQDSRTNVLNRYGMLMVTYTLRKFKAGSGPPAPDQNQTPRWQRYGQPGGGGGGWGPPPGGGG